MRAGEDNEGFVIGEGLPVRIGFREVPFNDSMLPFVFDDEGKMGGMMLMGGFCGVDRAEEDCEGIGAHGLDQDGAVRDLVEFRSIHPDPRELKRWGFRIQP